MAVGTVPNRCALRRDRFRDGICTARASSASVAATVEVDDEEGEGGAGGGRDVQERRRGIGGPKAVKDGSKKKQAMGRSSQW